MWYTLMHVGKTFDTRNHVGATLSQMCILVVEAVAGSGDPRRSAYFGATTRMMTYPLHVVGVTKV